ncbi:ADP-ribose pyrophosphatase [Alicyclobacillus cellulosilyticus]|uniref:ADP-ribose pyrophosphatase n=1 Tax=Alicyclobacillus cellulosilyticus TaxID=1003997 RepID=A0A917K2H1_9BACL|nr:NUDIX domain-containing protein [Alicyclobacillus cellulosilyticus]GGI97555.1 ADP-ribose pyrophosphatase [Alicyclobacillus cellulosilyticus]
MEHGIIRPAFGFHMNPAHRHSPEAVLVLAEFEDGWVWVRHRTRGWELPGGKLEPGESAEAAARREAAEEAGAVLGPMRWVAEYAYTKPGGTAWKWVFEGSLRDVRARPEDAETVDVRVFRPLPRPEDLRSWPGVSPLVLDDVYAELWRWWMTQRREG